MSYTSLDLLYMPGEASFNINEIESKSSLYNIELQRISNYPNYNLLILNEDQYFTFLKALGDWDVRSLLPAPVLPPIKPELYVHLSAAVKYGIKLVKSNEEMLDVFYAALDLLSAYESKVNGVGLVASEDGEPMFIDVLIDCGKEEWDRALDLLFKHKHAANVMNVTCERALFNVLK